MLATFERIVPYTSDITSEQTGKVFKFVNEQTYQDCYAVENERGDLGLDGEVLEYMVTYCSKRGFSCTCPAGVVGFAYVHHFSGVCKHVRWCVALEQELRAYCADLADAQQADPQEEPRKLDWYNPGNETSYFDGTRQILLLVGKQEADDATYARVKHAGRKPSHWTEAETRRDQERYASNKPFSLLK